MVMLVLVQTILCVGSAMLAGTAYPLNAWVSAR